MAPLLPSCWISFTTNPGDAPVWEDVSGYLRAVSIKRGRQYELDRFEAGTATITLDNRDRRFDPAYSSSPYYPNVLPMKRIRLTVDVGVVELWGDDTWGDGVWGGEGTRYTIFDGYVDGWPQTYVTPNEARVTVAATDAFKILSLAKMAASVYEYEVRRDAPIHWWRLGEKQGIDALDSTTGTAVTGSLFGAVNYGATGVSPYDGDTAIEFVDPNANGGGYFTADAPVVGAGDFSIEFWCNDLTSLATPLCQAAPGFSNKKIDESFVNRPLSWEFVTNSFTLIDGSGNYISQSGLIRFDLFTADFDFIGDISTGFVESLADSGWHHIVVTRSGNTFSLYADGELKDSDTFAFPLVGGSIMGPMDDYSAGAVVDLDEIAFYDSALSADRVLAHYEAAIGGWAGDASTDRVARALDAVGFSPTSRVLESGIATMGAAVLNNQAVKDHIQDVDVAEGGAFFVDASGNATFYNRHHLVTGDGATSQGVFGDGAGENHYSDIVVNYDDTHIINEARVTRAGGTTQTYEDATSQDEYLTRTFERSDVHTETDTDSLYAAQALIAQFKDPALRVESLTVQPQRDPDNLWPLVLELDLLDVIEVKRRPQALGTAIDQTVVIEGISHDVTPETWTTTYQLGRLPAPAWTIEDPVLGAVDSVATVAW